MGIANLLGGMQKCMRPAHISELCGDRAVVDFSGWYYQFAKKSTMDTTDQVLDKTLLRLKLLQGYGIKPILIIDGALVEAKKEVIEKRKRIREEMYETAILLRQQGRNEEAEKLEQRIIQRGTDINKHLMGLCRRENIPFIVAPFEADTQMAFMVHKGLADVVITDDSDMIVYGCPKILYKLRSDGMGQLFEKSKMPIALGKPYFENLFLWMCCVIGTDYNKAGVVGIGINKGLEMYRRLREGDGLDQVVAYVRRTVPKRNMNEDYPAKLEKAFLTFQHQLVFDPRPDQLKIRPLKPYPPGLTEEMIPYAGVTFDAKAEHFNAVVLPTTPEERKKLETQPKGVQCGKCDVVSPDLIQLFDHMKDVHPYKCKECGLKCRDSYILGVHIRVHTGEKPYKCDLCDQSFAQQCHLTHHIRSHTGERPFVCNICGAAFAQKGGGLDKHMLIHKGERSYFCDFCDRSYARSDFLKEHRECTHYKELGLPPVICHLCPESPNPKTFNLRSSLKYHILKQHKGEGGKASKRKREDEDE